MTNFSSNFFFRYLIEILGLQPDAAISGSSFSDVKKNEKKSNVDRLAFGLARGYPIEKYIDDLKTRVPMLDV